MNDFSFAMSSVQSLHVPDELEAALEAFAVKDEIFSDDDTVSAPPVPQERVPGLLAILDRDQTYLGPEPFTPAPAQGSHIAPSSKMSVGVKPANAPSPLQYDKTPRRIAVTVVQADTATTGTWIMPACGTLLDLACQCSDVWGFMMDFLHENVIQPRDKPLYCFDANLVPCGEHTRVAIFAVNFKPIPGFVPRAISVRYDDEVTLIPVFNVTQSKSANFIMPTDVLTQDLFDRVAFEWQHTCDYVFRNAVLGSHVRIHDLVDLTQNYQSPVLAYEAHALLPGDRQFKHPIVSRHFPILYRRQRRCSPQRRFTSQGSHFRVASPPPHAPTVFSTRRSPASPPPRLSQPPRMDVDAAPVTPKRLSVPPPKERTTLPEPPAKRQRTAPEDVRTMLGPRPPFQEELLGFLPRVTAPPQKVSPGRSRGSAETVPSSSPGSAKRSPSLASLSSVDDLPPASSKAPASSKHANTKMRKVFSSSSGSIHPTFMPFDPPVSEPHDKSDIEIEWIRAQRVLDVQEMKDTWLALASPTTNSPIYTEASFSPEVLRLLKRGKIFAELVDEHGINQATKKARVLVRNRKKAFQAGVDDLAEAMRVHNLEVNRLRALRGPPTIPVTKKDGQKRRTSML